MRSFRSLRQIRFDVVELTLILALACVATLWFGSQWFTPIDTGWLRSRYGPSKWSHNAEEWIVRDFFADRQKGFFVDVGAADARKGSNTYTLESKLGWSGIAVDALQEYAAGYQRYRPQTRFFSFFVSDGSDPDAALYVSPRNTEASSASSEFTRFYTSGAQLRRVPTIRLTDLLSKAGVTRVDFLSMDIELSEPKALAGLEIEHYMPALVCIETHPVWVRQAILDYFARHHYVVVGKYLWADAENLYFMPVQ